MPIYEDTKNGKPTGRYRVEVTVRKQRKRGRANSLREAKALEAALRQKLLEDWTAPAPRPQPAAVSAPTLRDGIKRAQGLLWAGQKTELESFSKMERIASIVGERSTIEDIDSNTIDSLVMSLKDSGCSDSTVNRYLSCLSAFLKFSYKRGLRKQPAPELDWNRENSGRIRWVSYEEERQLKEILPETFGTVVHIAIRTGLRASELLTLEMDQIDAQWVHLWETKNGHSRSVPITPELHRLLTELVASGRMPSYWQLRNEWDKARAAMGLENDPSFVFHTCRHSYATRAIQAGVNIRVLQKLMGHSTIQTTLRYAHVDDRTLADAALSAIAFHDDRVGKRNAPPLH